MRYSTGWLLTVKRVMRALLEFDSLAWKRAGAATRGHGKVETACFRLRRCAGRRACRSHDHDTSYPVHSARRRPLFLHGPGGRPARSDVAADAGLSRRGDRQPARKAARDPARLGPWGDGADESESRRATGVAGRLLRLRWQRGG